MYLPGYFAFGKGHELFVTARVQDEAVMTVLNQWANQDLVAAANGVGSSPFRSGIKVFREPADYKRTGWFRQGAWLNTLL